MDGPRRPVRIANCSGFYGDRLSAAREMVDGGPIDVLTGDYLAELTMFLLWRAREKDPASGYAATFLRQMEDVLAACLDRGIRIVSNAGGLNPAGLADRIRELGARLGLAPRVAVVESADLAARLPELVADGIEMRHADTGRPWATRGLRALTATPYVGGWGIAEALGAGADVVVCGRVTDASLVAGPAAWWFGWSPGDWDRLAGAVVAGHVLECGPQATGGNYAFFEEVPGLDRPGFPLAEVSEDGSSVITKHPGTGGQVSIGTVTAQLLYEIDGARYLNPDVVARFDTIHLEPAGPDRVRLSGVRGEPAPPFAKVAIAALGGYRNSATFVLTGLDVEAKANLARRALFRRLGGEERFAGVDVRLVRTDRADARTQDEATATLRVTVMDEDARKVGRAFSAAAVELALASYPGFYATAPPADEAPFAVLWPTVVPLDRVAHTLTTPEGALRPVVPTPSPATTFPPLASAAPSLPPPVPARALVSVPFGRLFGARSGDKAGNASVGVWARSDASWRWLEGHLTVDLFRVLLPEAASLEVRRDTLRNLRALTFVVVGLLGEGVSATVRADAQAKGLAEFLRARTVEVPAELLEGPAPVADAARPAP